jgi:alkylated DNA repair dioxygenase AlkB
MLNLFDQIHDSTINLLPEGGKVNYYGKILNQEEANLYYEKLLSNIAWKNDEAVIYGKRIITARKAAWYGDKEYNYTYSNSTKQALIWTEELLQLKNLIEEKSSETFNSCLLNLYHNGDEAMAWHSDGEKTLKENGAIASISIGAERVFQFKHKQNNKQIKLLLEHGSLLIMKDETQKNWLHRLAKSSKIKTPRINLTFRTIVGQ